MTKCVSDIFFVCKPENGNWGWKRQHNSYQSAQAEAERLAEANPGQEFFVLGALGSAKTAPKPAIYTELSIETDIPF